MQNKGTNNVFLLSDASTKDNSYLEGGHFQEETTENIKVKMLSISSSHGSNLQRKNIFRSGNELGLTLCPSQSAESLGRCNKEGSLVLQENLKMDEAEVGLSDSLSLHKLADNSPNSTRHKVCQFLDPEDIIISQYDHFPMYGINKRIGSILNHKKRTECGQIASRLSGMQMQYGETASVSQVIEFASEDHYQLESQRWSEKAPKREFSKSIRILPTCKDDLTGSTSRRAGGSFNFLRPKFVLDNFTELRSSNMNHEHSKHSINEFKPELCNLSGSSRLLLSEMKGNDEMISSCIKSSSPTKNFKSMNLLRSYLWSDDLHFLSKMNTSGSRRHSNCGYFVHFQNSNEHELLHQKLDKMASSSIHDTETEKIHVNSNSMDNVNGVSQNISNSFRYWLIGKNVGTEFSHGEQVNANPTKSAKVVSAKPQKESECPRLINLQLVSPSLVQKKECPDAKTEIVDGHIHHPISDNSGNINHRESSVSRTESMNVDLVISHVERPHEPNSGNIVERSLQLERCSWWLKRLRHSSSDIQSNSSKRCKIEVVPTYGEACSLSSSIINYNDSNSGQQANDMSKFSSSNGKYFHGASTEELKCWIRRWCRKDLQIPQSQDRMTASISYEQENTKLVPESSDGKQFPSIAAMALMGKVMKRLRRCEFQKKGVSVIWNIE